MRDSLSNPKFIYHKRQREPIDRTYTRLTSLNEVNMDDTNTEESVEGRLR